MNFQDFLRIFRSRAWDILLAEEGGKIVNVQSPANLQVDDNLLREIKENIEILAEEKKFETQILNLKDEVVNDDEKICLDLRGKGTINEILVVADSPNFRVYIRSDNRVIIDDDFSTLNKYTSYVNLYDAFEDADAGEYIFSSGAIPFLNYLKFSLIAYGSVTFKKIYAQYKWRAEYEQKLYI